MAFPRYLAMTGWEIRNCNRLPAHTAFMACHFSPYGTGLTNFPEWLPPDSLLILNDRTPIHGHDPQQIAEQLHNGVEALQCGGILLDFQRPDCEETAQLCLHLCQVLSCPVGVSDIYAANLPGPVFLPPAPPDVPLAEYLMPWNGREIWLEAALDAAEITLTQAGCSSVSLPCPDRTDGFEDPILHCHYRIRTNSDKIAFTLFRTPEDLEDLLLEAESLGITRSIGLWQELNLQESFPSCPSIVKFHPA